MDVEIFGQALTKLSFDDVRSIAVDLHAARASTADEVASTRAMLIIEQTLRRTHRLHDAAAAALAAATKVQDVARARRRSSCPTTTSRASPAPPRNSRAAWSSATTRASTTRCTSSAGAGTACPASPSSNLHSPQPGVVRVQNELVAARTLAAANVAREFVAQPLEVLRRACHANCSAHPPRRLALHPHDRVAVAAGADRDPTSAYADCTAAPSM